jgi:histone deacetylase 1/2
VAFVKSFNVPTLVLGGGGYTLRNVPRCWAYETAVLLDTPVKDTLPFNDYFEYYGPDYRLHLPVSNMANLNSPRYLDDVKMNVLKVLDGCDIAPSAPILTGADGTTQVPSIFNMDAGSANEGNPDARPTKNSDASIMARDSGGI